MHVFLSHSSTQKLFVRELVRNCPDSIDFWIDEKDISLGENIESKIIQAISEDCEYFLLVLDENAANSSWVKREIDLALEKEEEEDSIYLLPIVLNKQAWSQISNTIDSNRKYIPCFDYSEETIRAASSKLVTELFNMLVNKSTQRKGMSKRRPATIEDQLKGAEETYKQLASNFKQIVHPHRRNNPISVKDMRAKLKDLFNHQFANDDETAIALSDLAKKGYMQGYFFDGEIAFLANERFWNKTEFGKNTKALIAKKAVGMIHDDMSICIDGGSTTYLLADELSKHIKSSAISGLNVFTNSIPVARVLLNALNEIQISDRDTTCIVHLSGGWCRPSSMCTVNNRTDQEVSFESLFPNASEIIDISFMGASGVCDNKGFGITHKFEIPAKKAMYEAGNRIVVLADSMKFNVRQPTLFAPFSEKLTILTDIDLENTGDALNSDVLRNCKVNWVNCDGH